MTREELDFIGSMNMCDEISNEAYKKIVCHCEEQEPCEDAMNRILKRMWNCRGKHTTSIDKVKMEQIIRDELLSVKPQETKTEIEELDYIQEHKKIPIPLQVQKYCDRTSMTA